MVWFTLVSAYQGNTCNIYRICGALFVAEFLHSTTTKYLITILVKIGSYINILFNGFELIFNKLFSFLAVTSGFKNSSLFCENVCHAYIMVYINIAIGFFLLLCCIGFKIDFYRKSRPVLWIDNSTYYFRLKNCTVSTVRSLERCNKMYNV